MRGDLHPYDDIERRFRDDDVDPSRLARGRELVADLLGLSRPPASAGLRYDLSFYSGGTGCLDRLRIALPCAAAEVDAIVARRGHATPEALVADPTTREEFEWLVRGDDDDQTLRAALQEFIAGERADFQPLPDEGARVWFERGSDVNSWLLLYEQDGRLCLICFDQG